MALSFPRNIFMEMFLDGGWQDVTTRVRQADPISITRGRSGEQGEVAPGSLRCKLDNMAGDFTLANPLGQWYGKLKQGTPVRFGITDISDPFTRTVSNGWGSTPSGEAWTANGGSGGTVQASDFSTNGSVARHSVPAANAYRYSTLATVSYRDVEVAATVTVGGDAVDVTGAAIEPNNLILRHSGGNYYMTRVSVSSTDVVSISIHHSVDGQLIAPVTVVGLADDHSSKVLRVRMQAEGQTIRAKVFAPGAEPAGWHVEVHDTRITTAGAVGIRNGIALSNTNTKPLIFQVDNYEVRQLRFSGEISELKARWNTNHSDRWAELTAGTVLRRLKQGKTPLKSALRRAYLADTVDAPVQYWPCEEGADAKQFSSAIDTRHMSITGRPQCASFGEFLASSPLAYVNGSTWRGNAAPPFIPTTEGQLRFLIAVPKDGHGGGNDVPLVQVKLGHPGTLQTWELVYKSGGNIALNIYNTSGGSVYAGPPTVVAGGGLNGGLVRLSLELKSNGGNVDWTFSGYDEITTLANGGTGSQAGTFTWIDQVIIGPTAAVTDIAIGHIVVQSAITSTFELATEFHAWRGDTPLNRLDRLTRENGMRLAFIGSSTLYRMGPQLPTTLYTLLQECQDAAQGTLYDSRFTGNAVHLRTLNATYAQDSRATIDYAASHVAPKLEPNADDKPIRNDVTAKRLAGGEYRVSREAGPMNAQDPGTDDQAVGRFDQQVPVNVQTELQLPGVAGWALNLGTTEAERFPKVMVNLRAPTITAALQAQLLDLEIDDRITLTGLDVNGYYDDIGLLVRGYVETYNTANEHTIQYNCAPYDPYRVAVFGSTAVRWSTADSELNTSLTSSGTSIVVKVTKGQPWGTSSGNFPLDIMVGGERIRISAIAAPSAATPPLTQVFTVASSGRAINGVVKAHDAGAKVTVFEPVYFGR